MLATRQVLGNVARSRVMGNLALRRTMATVTDSPLDKKVCRAGLAPTRRSGRRRD